MLLGSLMHAVRHCEGKESPAFWHHIVIYVMFFAAITQPLWLLAEVLTAKRLQKICFLSLGAPVDSRPTRSRARLPV